MQSVHNSNYPSPSRKPIPIDAERSHTIVVVVVSILVVALLLVVFVLPALGILSSGIKTLKGVFAVIAMIGFVSLIILPDWKGYKEYKHFAEEGQAIEAKIVSVEHIWKQYRTLIVAYWDDVENKPVSFKISTTLDMEKRLPVGSTIWIYKLDKRYKVASWGYDKTLPHEEELLRVNNMTPSK